VPAGMEPHHYARVLATWAYAESQRNMEAAIERLKNYCCAYGIATPTHPKVFITQWATRFVSTGGVDDAPRSGRPRIIPEEDAQQVATLLAEGYNPQHTASTSQGPAQPSFPFKSFAEAILLNPIIGAIVSAYQASRRTWLQAIHNAMPSLGRRKLEYKKVLTPDNKAERMAVAQRHLARMKKHPRILETVVWIDCASVWIGNLNDVGYMHWCDTTAVKDRMPLKSNLVEGGKHIKLNFIAAVNARGGLVWLDFVSGTTEPVKRSAQHIKEFGAVAYEVSHMLPLSAHHNVHCSSSLM
jgi:hypothetical protein